MMDELPPAVQAAANRQHAINAWLSRRDGARFEGDDGLPLREGDRLDWTPAAVEAFRLFRVGLGMTVPREIPALRFLERFTAAQRDAISIHAMLDVRDMYRRTAAATWINLDDPEVIGGLDALLSLGIITIEDKAAILA